VWGDSAYQSQGEVIHALAPQARDMTHRRYRRASHVDRIEQRKNRHKSRVRAKVEHPFLVLKVLCGFRKVRYRGLAKNAERLNVAFAPANLFMLRRALLRLA
jgi:IS5 family transposase